MRQTVPLLPVAVYVRLRVLVLVLSCMIHNHPSLLVNDQHSDRNPASVVDFWNRRSLVMESVLYVAKILPRKKFVQSLFFLDIFLLFHQSTLDCVMRSMFLLFYMTGIFFFSWMGITELLLTELEDFVMTLLPSEKCNMFT